HVGGHGNGAAPAGATGNETFTKRIVRRVPCRVFGGGAHAELIHVGAPQQHRIVLFESRQRGGGERRAEGRQHATAGGGDLTGNEQIVFAGDGYAGEATKWFAGLASAIELGGMFGRAFGERATE